MRRTDEAFKEEVLRRSRAYRARRAKQRKQLLALSCCLVVAVSLWHFAPGGEKLAADSANNMESAMAPAENGMEVAPESPAAPADTPMEAAPGAPAPDTKEETAAADTIQYLDKTFHKSDLSPETIQWLEWFNSLSEEGQLSVSFVPEELYELCGYPMAEAMTAPEE